MLKGLESVFSPKPAENPVPDVFKFDLLFGSEDQGHVILVCKIKSSQMVQNSASESFRECLEARCLWELTSEPSNEKKIALDSVLLVIRICQHIKKQMLKIDYFWLLGESGGEVEAVARRDAEQTLIWKTCQLRSSCFCFAEPISCCIFSLLSIVQRQKTNTRKKCPLR